jgi:hypothetical protein
MSLMGFGDCLKPGCYLLHSRHRRAAHFVDGETLISLVTTAAGNGPNHIVVSDSEVQLVWRVVVREKVIELDGEPNALSGKAKYSSYLPPAPRDHPGLKENVEALDRRLHTAAPAGSMPALILSRPQGTGSVTFEQGLAKRLAEGSRALRRGCYDRGVRLLLGTGTGLTPSGDDFIAGFVTGLCLAHGRYAPAPRYILDSICRAAGMTNIISRTALSFCCRGRVYERVKDLLVALFQGFAEEVEYRAASLMEVGHASGADFAHGLLCSLQDGLFG